MIILRQLLSAEVKAYIADYLTSPSSYFAALQQLQRRYGQQQLVASVHLQTLHYLQRVRDDDPAGLVNLSRAVFGAIRALSGSGYEQDHLESSMTLEIVVDKLPHRLKGSWGMKVYKMAPKPATLKDLAVWLDTYALGETMFHKERPDQKNVRPRPNGNHPAILATQLPAAAEASPDVLESLNEAPMVLLTQPPDHARGSANSSKCPCCDRFGHVIYKCATFRALDPQCRYDLVKVKRLCFRCLKADHRLSDCPSKRQC